jgi:hypothetical protein
VGESSYILTGAPVLKPLPTSSVALTADSRGRYSLTLQLPEDIVEAICTYTIVIESRAPRCSVQYTYDSTPSRSVTIPLSIQPATGCLFHITAELQNSVSLVTTEAVSIDTRKLLASTELLNGSIQVNCTYVNMAPSSGCYIIVMDTSQKYSSSVIVSPESSTRFPDLLPGSYGVLVYGKVGESEITLTYSQLFYTSVDVRMETARIEESGRNKFAEGFGAGISAGILVAVFLAAVTLIVTLKRHKSHHVATRVKFVTAPNAAYSTVHVRPSTPSATNNTYQHHHKDSTTKSPLYDVVK